MNNLLKSLFEIILQNHFKKFQAVLVNSDLNALEIFSDNPGALFKS